MHAPLCKTMSHTTDSPTPTPATSLQAKHRQPCAQAASRVYPHRPQTRAYMWPCPPRDGRTRAGDPRSRSCSLTNHALPAPCLPLPLGRGQASWLYLAVGGRCWHGTWPTWHHWWGRLGPRQPPRGPQTCTERMVALFALRLRGASSRGPLGAAWGCGRAQSLPPHAHTRYRKENVFGVQMNLEIAGCCCFPPLRPAQASAWAGATCGHGTALPWSWGPQKGVGGS